ncbi:sigma factor [Streptomyces sp. DG2A-72]|uniref:sigma factor n=1 Tax=Streptomyces sp. DG2A-72 TaxID=3051386 RepID=UPI00265C05FE|nr:sigma factor [Streptomyces sp. DG2A-72]MDO0939415.1 sigma factor [Streptomyces sp. DG2A-72]
MSRAEEFEELRPLLIALAYRILGSESEAEEAVREAWLCWAASPTYPPSLKAYLAAVVTRISTDVLRSARLREGYAGPLLPGPLLSGLDEDPERSAELADSLSTAALLLLERLSPIERAVFVLREVFGFGWPETASTVGCSQAACRRLAAGIFPVGGGCGEALPWPKQIVGAETASRVLAAIIPPLVHIGVTLEQHQVNGRSGVIFRDRNGKVINALALDIFDGRIHAIHLVTNPARQPPHDGKR